MDRRRYPRFNINLEVGYRILESLKSHKHTLTEDVCEGGVRITLDKYIRPQTRLELIIKIPGEKRPVAAIGRIAWIKKVLLADHYTAGIDLVYLQAHLRKLLFKYVMR